ncbi:deoxyribodipyrimidine photo-lyase, partial [bacterium]|nr:deoxyribodipyrimidine photo-lyase [bacterium]
MKQGSAIFWFRQDLRLADNPGLLAAVNWAAENNGDVIPVYIWAPDEEGIWPPGGATKVWLNQSLKALAAEIGKLGSRLRICEADPKTSSKSSLNILQALAEELGAGAVFWNRRYEPAVIARDKEIKSTLKESGLVVETFNGALLLEPWQVATKEGKPYQVFTPYWRTCLNQIQVELEPPLKAPKRISPERISPKTMAPGKLASKNLTATKIEKLKFECTLEELQLLPDIKWEKGITEAWMPGEQGALKQLDKFLQDGLDDYSDMRNRPDIEGVSRMSPHLHFGEISPRSLWFIVKEKAEHFKNEKSKAAALSYLREVGWREFSHHLLYYFPQTPTEPLRGDFKLFPWENNPTALKAWQKGLTGYPIVDAGMRELWHTGIMHNRVRMIVASFLVKHLRLPWLAGAKWFWDTLVDADLAQNTMGWQWSAGCGADAAPYFRVFNPILQGEKFDTDGAYVRKWVPELAKMKSKYIHRPWEAPPLELIAAGVTLGENYPLPIVEHGEARNLALAAFQKLKESRVAV